MEQDTFDKVMSFLAEIALNPRTGIENRIRAAEVLGQYCAIVETVNDRRYRMSNPAQHTH